MKSTNVPAAVYDSVGQMDGGRCAWCVVEGDMTLRDLQFHHRIPRSRARNLHDVMNGVMLCLDHHTRAHAGGFWPWLVPGSTLRGEYRGPDPLYGWVYNGDEMPTLDVLAAFRDVPVDWTAWAMMRAVRAREEGVGRG